MRNSVVIPVMGVLTVIAAAVGLQLGESAIAQIDPVHFEGERRPLQDVSRDARGPEVAAFTSAYGWAQGNDARLLDCGDCRALSARQAYGGVGDAPPADPAPREWPNLARPEPADVIEYGDAPRASAYSRYLHYPVTQDQEDIADSLAIDDDPDLLEDDASEPAGL